MKKRIAWILSATLLLSVPGVNVFAAGNDGLYLETKGQKENQVKLTVESTDKLSDAVFTIKYDSDAYTVTEDDVKVSENVDMYAVNVPGDGTVAFTYVSDDAVEGDVCDLTFTVNGTFDASAFSIEGTAHDAEGNEVAVSKSGVTVEKEEVKPSQEGTKTDTQKKSVASVVKQVIKQIVQAVKSFFSKLFGRR